MTMSTAALAGDRHTWTGTTGLTRPASSTNRRFVVIVVLSQTRGRTCRETAPGLEPQHLPIAQLVDAQLVPRERHQALWNRHLLVPFARRLVHQVRAAHVHHAIGGHGLSARN